MSMPADCDAPTGCGEEAIPGGRPAAVPNVRGSGEARDHNCATSMRPAHLADRGHGWLLQGPDSVTAQGARNLALKYLTAGMEHPRSEMLCTNVEPACWYCGLAAQECRDAGVNDAIACAGCSVFGGHICHL